MDLRPAQRERGELGLGPERVIVLVDKDLNRDERNEQLGRLEEAQVLQIHVDLERPVLGGGVDVVGQEGVRVRRHGDLG